MIEKVRVCIELPKGLYEGIVKNPDNLSNGVIYDAIRNGKVVTNKVIGNDCSQYFIDEFMAEEEMEVKE